MRLNNLAMRNLDDIFCGIANRVPVVEITVASHTSEAGAEDDSHDGNGVKVWVRGCPRYI